MGEPSDVELLQQWRSGDVDAGEELLARHFISIYRFFATHVANDIEDLTQRTFEACIAGRDRIRDDAAFRGYLFGIARKQLATHIHEKQQRKGYIPISEATSLPMHSSPSRAFARVDRQRVVLHALAELPDDVRPAVEMFYLEGRKMREIAAALGVPLGTIKSRLFRGRNLLRDALASDPGDDVKTQTLRALEDASAEIDES